MNLRKWPEFFLVFLIFLPNAWGETLEQRLESIRALEKQVQEKYQEVANENQAASVMRRLTKFHDQLDFSSAESQELGQSFIRKNKPGIGEELTERIAPVAQYMTQIRGAWSELHDLYGQLEIARNNYAMDEMMEVVDKTYNEFFPGLKGKKALKLTEARDTLRASYDDYQQRLAEGKTVARDRTRYWPVAQFLEDLEPFMDVASTNVRTPRERFAMFREKTGRHLVVAREWASYVFSLPRLWRIFYKQPFLGPLAFPALRRSLRWRGYRNDLVGKENIPPPLSDRPGTHPNPSLDIIAPAHTHGYLDLWTTLQLKNERPTAMWNMYSERLKKILAGHPEILDVLGDKKSLTRLIEQAKSGVTRSLIVFPEANLSAAFTGGLRPVTDPFTWVSLPKIRRAGIAMGISAVSAPRHHRTRGDFRSGQDTRKLTTVVAPYVPSHIVDLMVSAGGGLDMISLFIMQSWMDANSQFPLTEKGHVVGSLPIDEARTRMRENLVQRTRCETVFQAVGF